MVTVSRNIASVLSQLDLLCEMLVPIMVGLNKSAVNFTGNPLRCRNRKCLLGGTQCGERRTGWIIQILARTSEAIHVQQILPMTGAPKNLKPSNQISSQNF